MSGGGALGIWAELWGLGVVLWGQERVQTSGWRWGLWREGRGTGAGGRGRGAGNWGKGWSKRGRASGGIRAGSGARRARHGEGGGGSIWGSDPSLALPGASAGGSPTQLEEEGEAATGVQVLAQLHLQREPDTWVLSGVGGAETGTPDAWVPHHTSPFPSTQEVIQDFQASVLQVSDSPYDEQ